MIPFLDLKAQHATLRAEIEEAIGRVLDSGQFILGEEGAALESEFASWTRTRHAIGVSTGTSALHLALIAARVSAGDEVITTPFTFLATVASIDYVGARPVLVDIDPTTFTIDVTRLETALTPRTRAVIPVHLYGHPAAMDPIMDLARRRGLAVIEDAAQAHGARHRDRAAGAIGDLGCFSFYPTKNLGACGEGGMIVTDDDDMAQHLGRLRDWGQVTKGHHEIKGFNARLQEIQAAILRIKIRHIDAWNDARRRHAAAYDASLEGTEIIPPVETPGMKHVYHAYTVRVPRRDAVREKLAREGVGTAVHYPTPVHLQPAYADLGYGPGAFPEAEKAAGEVLCLPIYPELSDADRESVVRALRRAV